MNYNTRLKLAETTKLLMEKSTLDRISVKEIVDKAEVSRQTFYRNFDDKYHLVNWYFDVIAMKSFKEMSDSYNLRNALISKFNYIRSEKYFFIEAFKITGDNSVVRHDYEFILEFYTKKINNIYKKEISPDIIFLLEFYCHASISMTVDWALSGMKRTSEDMADLLISALPVKLLDAVKCIL